MVTIFKDIKLENFNSIETFFSIYKISIFLLCSNVARFFKNSFIWEDETLKKIILKGRGFRGGSDEKMRRMWLGLEIDVVGLPPFV